MGPNNYNPNPGQLPPNYQGPANPYGPPAPYGPPSPYGPATPQGQPQVYGPAPGVIPPQPGYGPQGPYPAAPGQQPGYPAAPNPYAEFMTDPYDSHGPKPPSPGKKIALAGVGLFAVIAVIGVLVAGSPQQQTPQTQNNNQQASAPMADIVPRPDGDLDLTKKIDTAKSLKAQSLQAKTKEQVNLSSGFSFMVEGTGNYTSSTVQPAGGKKFVIVQVAVGNRSEKANIPVSYLDFKLRNGSNELLSGHPLTQQVLNNPLSSPSEIKPGQQIEGRLIFEVNSAEKDWVLVHKETYQKTTDNTTFTVEGRITVDTRSDDSPSGAS